MNADRELDRRSERIERLLEQVEQSTDAATWPKVQALIDDLTALYGAGMSRLLEYARKRDGAARFEEQIAGDELLRGLLMLNERDLQPSEQLVQIGGLKKEQTAEHAAERCAICAAGLEDTHRHLVDLLERKIECACTACALLFESRSAGGGRYLAIPRRVLVDPRAAIGEEAWAKLQIPVRLAFLFRNSARDRWVASYPSPAGAVESELELSAMDELLRGSGLFSACERDVEAVIVYAQHPGASLQAVLAPIDRAYALVALVRKTYRGFDGGDEFRASIDRFFDALLGEARPL